MQYVMQRAQSTKLDGRRMEDKEQQKGEREKVIELVACGRCLASSLEIATAR